MAGMLYERHAEILPNNLHRIKHLDLAGPDYFEWLLPPAPILESISIEVVEFGGEFRFGVLPDGFLGHNAPRLSRLSLDGLCVQ